MYTLKHEQLLNVQLAVVRKIVRELRDFDNVYYEVCNEPYFGGVTMPWQRRVIEEIVSVENGLSGRHLISLNVANGRKQIERPDPHVSLFNFHYCVPPDTVTMNYSLNKAIGENETGFRGREDVLYRTEGWDFLLAGGALYNNLDYSFTPGHPNGTLTDYRSPGGGSVELRQQLGILKAFMERFDFVRMTPDRSIVRRISPSLTAYALVDPGVAYAVYLHVPLPNKPKKLADHLREGLIAELTLAMPAGSYTCEWINTKTGQTDQRESLVHTSGDRLLRSPTFADDIALRITRKGSAR